MILVEIIPKLINSYFVCTEHSICFDGNQIFYFLFLKKKNLLVFMYMVVTLKISQKNIFVIWFAWKIVDISYNFK
jgi:hypothetical protein